MGVGRRGPGRQRRLRTADGGAAHDGRGADRGRAVQRPVDAGGARREPGLPGHLPAGPHRAAAGARGAPARRGGAVRHPAHRPADRRRVRGAGRARRWRPGPGPVRGRRRRPPQHRAPRVGHRVGAAGRARRVRAAAVPAGPRAAARAPAARAEPGAAPAGPRGDAAGRRRALGVRAPLVPGARREPGRLPAGALRRAAAGRHRVAGAAAAAAGRASVHHGGRGGRELPARPRLPGRRRRTPDDPGRRDRHEHRHPRRPRAGLAAGLGAARAGRRRAAGQLRRGTRAGGPDQRDPLVARPRRWRPERRAAR